MNSEIESEPFVEIALGKRSFYVPLARIQKFPESYFCVALKPHWNNNEYLNSEDSVEEYKLLVDRDARLFRFIAMYLELGCIPRDKDGDYLIDPTLFAALREEADYFCLSALVAELDSLLVKQRRTTSKGARQLAKALSNPVSVTQSKTRSVLNDLNTPRATTGGNMSMEGGNNNMGGMGVGGGMNSMGMGGGNYGMSGASPAAGMDKEGVAMKPPGNASRAGMQQQQQQQSKLGSFSASAPVFIPSSLPFTPSSNVIGSKVNGNQNSNKSLGLGLGNNEFLGMEDFDYPLMNSQHSGKSTGSSSILSQLRENTTELGGMGSDLGGLRGNTGSNKMQQQQNLYGMDMKNMYGGGGLGGGGGGSSGGYDGFSGGSNNPYGGGMGVGGDMNSMPAATVNTKVASSDDEGAPNSLEFPHVGWVPYGAEYK